MTCLRNDSRKILLLYSSIGNGHVSAARAIREAILRQSSGARVLLQDIRAFMNPAWRRIDESLYWFIANHLPESFGMLFRAMQVRGNRVASLSSLPNDYPETKVAAFLQACAPDVVLATHYGAAQVLGTLRERGELPGVRLGWLHTDFFEGYFPRISKRIDLTFLAHEELEARWIAAGVPEDKVATTGMPVSIPETPPAGRREILSALGLDPASPLLLVAGGKEGAGDFGAVIESIACHRRAVQVIAVCGRNARLRARLEALGAGLRPRLHLTALGWLPHAEMMSLMLASDLLITKAGGMTPSEAFFLGIPTILLDAVSGHERENAEMLARLGLARLAANPEEVGRIVEDFLGHSQAAMRAAQQAFRAHTRTGRIVQFALEPTPPSFFVPVDFGAENGTPVDDIEKALARIGEASPAEVELLLSHSTSKSPQAIVTENPFGHLAIRLGETVFSANYIADPAIDPNFLQQLGLADYLYGVRRPSASQIHANTYGMAYGRETFGLRVSGIAGHRLEAMRREAHRIEEGFRQGSLLWDRVDFNCADVVERILLAGGYAALSLYDRLGLPAMPLDVFEKARACFGAEAGLRVDLVAYRQVPGSRGLYRFSRFPLSIGQPFRSVARLLGDPGSDPLEAAVTKQVAASFADRRLLVDDLRARGLRVQGWSKLAGSRARIDLALAADLRHLIALAFRGGQSFRMPD